MANPLGKGGPKKGEVRNPMGRPPLEPLLKDLRETSFKDFCLLIQHYGALRSSEIVKRLEEDLTGFERIVARMVFSAGMGDKDALKVLLERLWGKVREEALATPPERIEAPSPWVFKAES